jgi:tripartite-type tricarboxylate transporter receptor subunit TctC
MIAPVSEAQHCRLWAWQASTYPAKAGVGAAALVIFAMSSAAVAASAEDYPLRIVHFATSEAGGAGDVVSRILGQGLSAAWGQQVVIENRPATAAEFVAKAKPDAHTLLLYGNTIWIAPLMRTVQWEPARDFAPVMLVARIPNVLVVTRSLPVKSVRELITLAKQKPGALNYASSALGSSTHLAAELFNAMAGIDIVRINYKGVATAITDLTSGRVQVMFLAPGSVAPQIKADKLRALAVTGEKQTSLFPGVPTVAASGVPGYESAAMFGLFAPAKTPASLVARVNQDAGRVLNRADVAERLLGVGAEVVGNTPEAFAALLKKETSRWTAVIRKAGIRAD